MNETESPFDPSKLVWFGLIVVTIFGLGIAVLRPPDFSEHPEMPTPGPSPEVGTLQCLDGKTFRSVDEYAGPPAENGFPVRGHWTLRFADGGYLLDQFGAHEAGRYRCDGSIVNASNPLGSHRGQNDVAGGRLAWDGQGYELVETPAPKTATTSG